MYFCYNILSKPLDASFEMESPLPDEEMDAKVRKKKESLPFNSSIPRTFAPGTPSHEAYKGIFRILMIYWWINNNKKWGTRTEKNVPIAMETGSSETPAIYNGGGGGQVIYICKLIY
jgi:hypothetical protein